ncbi:short-chain dehydrogenase [Erythrobacter sp. JL475]|nr:short-chain dehydrogenase [Erythrobacter sp. JL475]
MTARTIIVTGAFGYLGSAVADHFEALGDKVGRIDYAPTPEGSPAYHIGGVDLSDAEAAKAALAQVTQALGAPSVLVNIAGGFVWETLDDGGPDTWERMFRMNALTAVTMCKTCIPNLISQPGAAIINIGAAAAAKADAGMGAYAASKAAVARLTESLAAELAGEDINVNAVLPTIIDTPTNRADMPDADTSGWVRAADIASVIAFLASDAARSITGESIRVSRGRGD